MRTRSAVAAAMGLLACGPSFAQHVDILVWDAGGTVGVGEYDFDNAAPSDRRVQIGRLNDLYSVDSPGFIALTGSDALPGGEDLMWDFLPMTVDAGTHEGYRSTILYWDGQGSTPEFGPTETDDYEFSIFSIAGSAAATGGAGLEPGNAITTTPPNGSIHEHPFYFLDDNGDGLNTTLPAAGVYVVALQLSIGELEPSGPVFMVWATPELSVLPAIQPAALWVTDRVDTLFVEPLDGDFNSDGLVDAADYTVWRDGLRTVYQPSDYDTWVANFGATAPSSPGRTAAVPEPRSLFLLAALSACGAFVRPSVFSSSVA